MDKSGAFQVDLAAIERFIDKSNSLYEALGLQMGAPHSEIVARNSALRKINTPQFVHLVAMRAMEVDEVLGNAAKRKEYDRTIRDITRGDLRHYLDSMVEDDNILDDKELAGFYRIGSKKGLPQAELQAILDDYLKARRDIKVGGAAAPAPTRSAAPASPPPTTAPRGAAPPPAPAGRPAPARMRPSEERSRWVIAATASAGVLGAVALVVAHVPFSFRLLAIGICIGIGIGSMRLRKDWQAWIAAVAAVFVGAGHPELLGVVVGVIGVSLAAMVVHALGGRPLIAAATATVVFAASVGIGLGESRSGWRLSGRSGEGAAVGVATARAPGARRPETAVAPTEARPTSGRAPTRAAAPAAATRKAEIHLIADPAGADVYVAGKRVGVTPATCSLEPGRYTVRFSKTDHEPVERSLVVGNDLATKGVAARTIEVSLAPAFVAQLSGRWTGTIDGKPLMLVVSSVGRDGGLTGNGAVTLASGEKGFRFEGSYKTTDRRVRIVDLNTGLEFTGSLAGGTPATMSGTAKLPNVPLERSWSASK